MNKTEQDTLANLSAHIRNRLTCIMLSASTLRVDLRATLSSEQQQELSQIDRTAKEIQSIVDRLIGLIPRDAPVRLLEDKNTISPAEPRVNQLP